MADQASLRPARLNVGVIGTGRVGAVLGAALARAGHQVVAVSAVSERSRAAAARMLPGVPVAPPPEVLAAADLVLLTVPDDVLPGLVSGLAAPARRWPARLLAHTSGRSRRGRAGPGHPPRRAADGAAPGDDVHRPPGRPGPAGRDQLRGDRAGAAAARGRGPGHRDGRRAGRSSTRPTARCTTPALASAANHLVALVAQSADLLRAAGVAEPSRMLGAAAVRRPRQRAAARRRRASPGRSPAATRTPWLGTSTPCATRPRRRCGPTSRWPGSPPTGRWRPASSAPLMPSACSTCWPGPRDDPRGRPDQARPGRGPARAGLPRRAGAHHGRAAPWPPGAAPPGPRPCRPGRKRAGLHLRQPAPVRRRRRIWSATRARWTKTCGSAPRSASTWCSRRTAA